MMNDEKERAMHSLIIHPSSFIFHVFAIVDAVGSRSDIG